MDEIKANLDETGQLIADEASAQLTLGLLDQGMQYLRDHLGIPKMRKGIIEIIHDELQQGKQEGQSEEEWDRIKSELQQQARFWENLVDNTREAIGIDDYKKRLDDLRKAEPIDNAAISALEREIAKRIQDFIYVMDNSNAASDFPTDIVSSNTPVAWSHFTTRKKDKGYAFTTRPNGRKVLCLSNRMNLLRHFKRYEEALEEADKVIILNPKLDEAYKAKGDILHMLGKDNEAIVAYQQYLTLIPEDDLEEHERVEKIISTLQRPQESSQ